MYLNNYVSFAAKRYVVCYWMDHTMLCRQKKMYVYYKDMCQYWFWQLWCQNIFCTSVLKRNTCEVLSIEMLSVLSVLTLKYMLCVFFYNNCVCYVVKRYAVCITMSVMLSREPLFVCLWIPFKNIFDFTTAGDWDCVAAVERLPALHYCVDFIFLSFGIMGFIVELWNY